MSPDPVESARPWTLAPSMAYCAFCSWELACATEAEKDQRKAAHEHLRHSQPLPTRELTGNTWQEQATDAVRQVAARGLDYTIFAALREFGISDPPNAKTALGRFAALIHDLHISHPVGYAPSERAGTKRSAAAVWNRDQTRCTDVQCRRKVGAA